VLVGFKAGVGCVIVVDQLPKLLGVHIHKEGLRIGISNGLVCEKPGKPDSALGGQPMPAWMAWNWRLGRCLVWIRPALTARLALVGP